MPEDDRDRLFAALAHDLRLPLFNIVGHADLLLDGALGPLTADQAEALQAMRYSARRAVALVEDLHDLARLDQGALPLRAAPVDLVALTRQVIQQVAGLARLAKTAVRLDTDLPALLVTTDERRVERILLNLVDNATRHSPPGGQVTVHLASDGHHAVVAVADQGPGVAPADQERLFTRYTPPRAAASGWG